MAGRDGNQWGLKNRHTGCDIRWGSGRDLCVEEFPMSPTNKGKVPEVPPEDTVISEEEEDEEEKELRRQLEVSRIGNVGKAGTDKV